MQDLKSIYQDIKNKIALSREPVFIYTGVGTAAGMRNTDGVLELANYHQYPPLLQDLKNIYPSLRLFIVLIDPYQESPPYMIKDIDIDYNNTLYKDSKEEKDDEKKQTVDIYDLLQKNITVYTYRKNVITAPHIDPLNMKDGYIDITSELHDLNHFAFYKHNVTTLYHDFTGRRNDILAEYFDDEIGGEDLDHIIYGLSTREDHGCYFDLTALGTYMPYRLLNVGNGYKRISFFNIFKYIHTNSLDTMKNEMVAFPPYMQSMILSQQESVITTIKNDFKNNIFTTMRVLLRLIRGEEEKEGINNFYMFHYISQTKRVLIEELYQEGRYKELFDYLLDFFSKKMDIMAKLKEMDMTGRELIGFIINEHDKNIYNWSNTLNSFFPSLNKI